MGKFKRLGDILVAEEIISEKQLQEAIEYQKAHGGKLGEVLVLLRFVDEEHIVLALSKQLGIPYFSYESGNLIPAPDQNLDELIPTEFATRNTILPLSRDMFSLTVAVFDPLDLMVLDNLKQLAGCDIRPVVATKTSILKGIEQFYGKEKLFRNAVESAGPKGMADQEIKEISSEDTDLSLDKLVVQAEEAPVIKLVDLIIRQAIEELASDIHIEPHRDALKLRYRIDGILYDMPSPSASLYLPVISRISPTRIISGS